jgi:hypothetical protein
MGEEAFDRSDWRAVIDGHALESHDPAEWLRYGVALLHGLEPGPEQGRQQQQAGLAFVKAQQEGASAVAVETAQRLVLLQLMVEACDLSGLSAAAGVAQQQIEHLRHRLSRDLRHSGRTVIHTIHHFACTGGTVICKCLASMHRVALVSEVNPLSRFSSDFEPRDPLIMLEKSYRHLTPEEIKEDFLSRMALAVKICLKDGMDLVIRDHSHTDFCMGQAVSGRTPILEFLQDDYDLVSVVTLRHPLDSYLGLRALGWHDQFIPSSLDEYSKRYLTFLDHYSDFPWRRYEDFCAHPERFLQELCSRLDLEFRADFLDRFGDVHLSGDSGRSSGDSISLRPRRPVPEDVQGEIETSGNYRQLLEIMGYVS